MGDIERRLSRLEGETRTEPEDERKREKDRAAALHMAECSNEEGRRDGREPFFEITAGEVFSAYDGRPITDGHQALCERFYWQNRAWGVGGYDEETEAFYTPAGEFALSRTTFDLRRVFQLTSGGEG